MRDLIAYLIATLTVFAIACGTIIYLATSETGRNPTADWVIIGMGGTIISVFLTGIKSIGISKTLKDIESKAALAAEKAEAARALLENGHSNGV